MPGCQQHDNFFRSMDLTPEFHFQRWLNEPLFHRWLWRLCPKVAVHIQFGTSLAGRDWLPSSLCGGIEREQSHRKITPHDGWWDIGLVAAMHALDMLGSQNWGKMAFVMNSWHFACAFSVGSATVSWLLCFLRCPVHIHNIYTIKISALHW